MGLVWEERRLLPDSRPELQLQGIPNLVRDGDARPLGVPVHLIEWAVVEAFSWDDRSDREILPCCTNIERLLSARSSFFVPMHILIGRFLNVPYGNQTARFHALP
jgi:hypothetical protein